MKSNAKDVKLPYTENIDCDRKRFIYMQNQFSLGNSEKLNIHLPLGVSFFKLISLTDKIYKITEGD